MCQGVEFIVTITHVSAFNVQSHNDFTENFLNVYKIKT